jgi:hypothetical protein
MDHFGDPGVPISGRIVIAQATTIAFALYP